MNSFIIYFKKSLLEGEIFQYLEHHKMINVGDVYYTSNTAAGSFCTF